MSIDQQRRILARNLRPLAVRQYAESRQWSPVEGVRGRFWLFRHPEQHLRQLQIPMDAEDASFTEAMLDVVQRIAELERRSVDAVLADLQWPDADILRVRVASRDAESGQLSLAADVMLREGARRALLASACSVINPVAIHPRMSRGEADVMLAACRAGQTEVGSYVFKIICPLHAVPREIELPDATPFTRKVTTHLMRATADLVDSIEHSRVEAYLETHAERPMLSWNLCDALLRMQPEQNAGQLELSTTWAADPRLPPPPESQAPSRVAIKAEYIPEIQRAAQILRPSPAVPALRREDARARLRRAPSDRRGAGGDPPVRVPAVRGRRARAAAVPGAQPLAHVGGRGSGLRGMAWAGAGEQGRVEDASAVAGSWAVAGPAGAARDECQRGSAARPGRDATRPRGDAAGAARGALAVDAICFKKPMAQQRIRSRPHRDSPAPTGRAGAPTRSLSPRRPPAGPPPDPTSARPTHLVSDQDDEAPG